MRGLHVCVPEPRSYILAKDIVLDNRRESSGAVLVRRLGREAVSKVEQSPRFVGKFGSWMDPAAYGPSVELTTVNMDTTFELSGKTLGHCRFARRLHTNN